MIVSKPVLFVILMLSFLALHPQKTWAGGFKNHEFLELEDVKKKFWIDGAISVLAATGAFKDTETGQCVLDWYFKDTPKRNSQILAAMKQYPNHSPSSILMAWVENTCGKFISGK